MIKVKTKIPSGSLTLLTKPNAAGECAVYLRYYLGSYIKKSTDNWVNQKDWDSKRQCVKSSAKDAARINARLYDIKAEIDEALLEYDGQITADVIRSIMTGDDKGEVPLHSIKSNFIEYARYVNDMKYTKKAYGYSSWYNKVKYIDAFETFIKHFLKKKRFTLEDLVHRKLKLMGLWLDSEGIMANPSANDIISMALDTLIDGVYPKAKGFVSK